MGPFALSECTVKSGYGPWQSMRVWYGSERLQWDEMEDRVVSAAALAGL
jgi:hypothetical protein